MKLTVRLEWPNEQVICSGSGFCVLLQCMDESVRVHKDLWGIKWRARVTCTSCAVVSLIVLSKPQGVSNQSHAAGLNTDTHNDNLINIDIDILSSYIS